MWGVVGVGVLATAIVSFFLLSFLTGLGAGLSGRSSIYALSFVGASILVAPLIHVALTTAVDYLTTPKA